ncbi:NAD-dependent epimerase/dehydratase family protein [Fluviicola taffensis]|uniref:NAD-dependent epimerase/dehydratase n=1 Tax=Fluviicola taffensis (strain DSM 16823 / NCIMB 13979 / RW262) TaxID=755732 RepID=F2IAN0_FLUTR|nr:NAD-dependent epimerase/dehydratase family protein [Fluviicola taffensis]AEA44185.1 NAD-dependent epimerase/dehydratase [Fluviicola taffensis DSM 16823]
MILVTGSTGLLGSHVVVELLHKGYEVRAMYRDPIRKEVVFRLIEFYYPSEKETLLQKLKWFQGNVLDLVDVQNSLIGVSKVVHCAALVSFHRRDFNSLFKVNRRGTANMVNFALDSNVNQFVHVSSTAAIGSDSQYKDGLKRESNLWNPNDEVSGYSLSKFSAEKEVWRASEEGLPVSVVNPSVMFGPGSWEESSLQIFRTLNKGLSYYTKGSNSFVDVRDVTKLILKLIETEKTGHRYLVTGSNLSFKQLFDQICKQLQVKAPSKLAGPFLTTLAWRLSGILGRIQGTRPTITKESARSSHSDSKFSNEKLLKDFPDFEFTKLEDTIDVTIKGRME